ncbi:outer membrane usher protein [Obesumbacterium proteus]|uniref:outer membrane usher protein n=1 Tax=Obesumbacterium proteus TaxID=82983 RepID=UPI001033400D|nr:outer membrane usher protein [Obesumbacterium proteus]TBL78902.1 outer membrane usher protein [Obesumbacterium proteus]
MFRDYRLSPMALAIVAIIYCPETIANTSAIKSSPEKTSQTVKPLEEGRSDDYVEFNDKLMMQGGKVDIQRYSKGNPTLPGDHDVNLFINNSKTISASVNFIDDGEGSATPCITAALLTTIGVNHDELKEVDWSVENQTCIDLVTLIQQAKVHFDNAEQRLDIGIPQKYLLNLPKDYVDPSLWDSGINAAVLSYDLNAYHSYTHNTTSDSIYSGLMYGANIGDWHLRSRGMAAWNSDSTLEYRGQYTYLQRDISRIGGQFLLGESNTRGDYFDSYDVVGIRLYNDDRMLAGSVTGYAPVVHGTARTNAKVTIRQSGNVIYQATVPPGPFDITDLNTTGYGEDLQVTVQEADGSEQHFAVPFSSVSQLLREGFSRWEVNMGQLKQADLRSNPNVASITGARGLNSLFTGYTGLEATDNSYLAGILGMAVNTPVGGIAIDMTQSQMDLPVSGRWTGQSYRVSYSKTLETTNTAINVAAWRNSTRHYLSLSDAMSMRDDELSDDQDKTDSSHWQIKNQFQVNLNQPLEFAGKSYGSFYVTGSWVDYWQTTDKNTQYSIGYSNGLRWCNYSITAQRSYDGDNNKNDMLSFNISIPLSAFSENGGSVAGFSSSNSNYSTDLHGNDQLNTTASGSSEDTRYNYSVNASYQMTAGSGNDGDSTLSGVGGYGTYNSSHGPLSLSASTDTEGSRQWSLGASGGMVLHANGLTFTDKSISDNDTLVLIEAKGAKGSKVFNGESEIDSNGFAVGTGLNPFHRNDVALDISTQENDVEITSTSATTAPHSGAIVWVKFDTVEGESYLMELNRSDKGFIPLGADIYDSEGEWVGSVGQAGQGYARNLKPNDRLKVSWGSKVDQSCYVTLQSSPQTEKIALSTKLSAQTCVMQR